MPLKEAPHGAAYARLIVMEPTFTNLALVALTLLSATSAVVATLALKAALAGRKTQGRLQAALVLAVALGTLGLLILRWQQVPGWNLLHAHVDGLLLIVFLLAWVHLYLETRPRLMGVAPFVLPLMTLLLSWAVCASAWTYKPFHLDSLWPVWRAVHLGCVYLGTLSAAVAAMAGAAYLVFERRLKHKHLPLAGAATGAKVASLEAVEGVIVRAATLGFVLLSVGLVSGGVIMNGLGRVDLAPWGWLSPKVLLAVGAWLAYAVVMNVRFASLFRGRRAAWLAIVGFALLLGVYGVVTLGGKANAVGTLDNVLDQQPPLNQAEVMIRGQEGGH